MEKQTTTKLIPGRMPPLDQHHKQQQGQQGQRNNNSRGGRRNRGRGAIFAAWVLETFAFVLHDSSTESGHPTISILDVAGGAGQLAFKFGVRRGINTTVIDPRPLRLSSGQQRTLEYHRETGLRL
jgi:hypothetical protein